MDLSPIKANRKLFIFLFLFFLSIVTSIPILQPLTCERIADREKDKKKKKQYNLIQACHVFRFLAEKRIHHLELIIVTSLTEMVMNE